MGGGYWGPPNGGVGRSRTRAGEGGRRAQFGFGIATRFCPSLRDGDRLIEQGGAEHGPMMEPTSQHRAETLDRQFADHPARPVEPAEELDDAGLGKRHRDGGVLARLDVLIEALSL